MKIGKILSRQSVKNWINLIITVLIVSGIFVFIDIISWEHNIYFDLSPTKMHSLSPQTEKILKSLKKDIELTVFYEKGNRSSMADILNRYTYTTNKFKYRLVDLDRNPGEARKYGVSSYGSTVVASGEKKKILGYPGEEQVVNAILKVIRDKEKVIYFLKGHGENDLSEEGKEGYNLAKEAMEQENYLVKELFLMRKGEVPADASLLVVNGPKKALLKNEIAAISKYIKEGGKSLLMIDPYTAPNLVDLLKDYGIILGNDIIVDKESRLFGREYFIPLVPLFYKEHPIIRNFTTAAVFPLARSVETKEEEKEGVSIQSLAKTSFGSWAETDRKSADEKKVSFDKGKDKQGPVSVAAVISIKIKEEGKIDKKEEKDKKEKTKEGKIVVYGDSDFANNFYFNILGNKDLYLNTVSWLAEEEDLISLRPKTKTPLPVSPLFLTSIQSKVIFWSSVVIQPGLILLIGIIIYFRRKFKG